MYESDECQRVLSVSSWEWAGQLSLSEPWDGACEQFGHTSRNIEFLACDMIFDVNKHEMADTGEGPHI